MKLPPPIPTPFPTRRSSDLKAYAYELVEQLGWRTPDHVVAPMAGGSLITKIRKAFQELEKLGLAPDATRDRKSTRLNSSHGYISSAVFCLIKKKLNTDPRSA